MSEYTQGVCHDGAAILKDGQPLSIEQILEGLRERDEYRNHLSAIAEMTGNGDDIGAAYEGMNALVEDLSRHKRMFVAACETLGEIQQALGNDIVGIEPVLVKELVEDRDALAAHVERLQVAGDDLREPWHLNRMLGAKTRRRVETWDKARSTTPAASLARRDAKILREYADKLEADEAPDAEAGDMWDASQCADWMREQAEKAEGHQ